MTQASDMTGKSQRQSEDKGKDVYQLTVLVCGANVCLDMTIVVVFMSTRLGPGDFGTMLETSISAARTASKTWKTILYQ